MPAPLADGRQLLLENRNISRRHDMLISLRSRSGAKDDSPPAPGRAPLSSAPPRVYASPARQPPLAARFLDGRPPCAVKSNRPSPAPRTGSRRAKAGGLLGRHGQIQFLHRSAMAALLAHPRRRICRSRLASCAPLFHRQRPDGAWDIYPDAPKGDINSTVEVYAALRAKGEPAERRGAGAGARLDSRRMAACAMCASSPATGSP